MIPRGRLEALTDGVYAFAMTLLVINLDLPDDFDPANAAALLDKLVKLDGPLIAYVISFFVLGGRWLEQVADRGEPEQTSAAYAWTVLVLLFFVTLTPFSTMVVGRFRGYWPAVALYAANLILSGAMSYRITRLTDREGGRTPSREAKTGYAVFVASALLSVAISLVAHDYAMWAYFLNFAAPFINRFRRKA